MCFMRARTSSGYWRTKVSIALRETIIKPAPARRITGPTGSSAVFTTSWHDIRLKKRGFGTRWMTWQAFIHLSGSSGSSAVLAASCHDIRL
jgi:hypothetical protein